MVLACRIPLHGKAMSDLDAIVIGAGHNGLTCAAYLGMAGLRVRVFERRGVVGGACVTEEFYPGFRNSTAAYTVSLLQPKVIRDLKLHEYGLRIVERRAQNFLPLPDGRYLLTGDGRTGGEIAKFSAKDSARYPAYQAEINRVAGVVRSMALNAPPNLMLGSFTRAARELGKLAEIGKRLWQDDSLKAAFQLVHKSAGGLRRFLVGKAAPWLRSTPELRTDVDYPSKLCRSLRTISELLLSHPCMKCDTRPRKINEISCKNYRWWAREAFRNPTRSTTYRVPPLPNVPLNSNAYFQDCPTVYGGSDSSWRP
jgi:phytoene dehydrogenase-like protein